VIKRFFIYVHRKADTREIFYVGKGTKKKGMPYHRAGDVSRRNIFWQRVVARHGFTHEIVCEFDDERLAFQLECDLIAHYGRQCDGGCLCNLTIGGEGGSGRTATPETRAKMSVSASGKTRTDEHRRRLSAAKMGWKPSAEQAAAHSRRMSGEGHPFFGCARSAETRAKIGASRRGKLAGENHPFFGMRRPGVSAKLAGANGPAARRVIDTATGVEYGCILDAAAAHGIGYTTLSRWLSGARTNKSTLRYA
jgi:hypothetical protein